MEAEDPKFKDSMSYIELDVVSKTPKCNYKVLCISLCLAKEWGQKGLC